MTTEADCPMCEDIFPSVKCGPRPDLKNHPHTVAARPERSCVAAIQSYANATRQRDETLAACEGAGVKRGDDHPLASAILNAMDRLIFVEGILWDRLNLHHRWEVLAWGEWFAYVQAVGNRDGRDRPRLIVGRVTDDTAPECVREHVKQRGAA